VPIRLDKGDAHHCCMRVQAIRTVQRQNAAYLAEAETLTTQEAVDAERAVTEQRWRHRTQSACVRIAADGAWLRGDRCCATLLLLRGVKRLLQGTAL
jgi:hypothetical protein